MTAPLARRLLIVARDDRERFEALRAALADDSLTRVVLDRRVAERRRPKSSTPNERRRRDRRYHSIAAELVRQGWTVVPVGRDDPGRPKR